jgi:hypothetical protein
MMSRVQNLLLFTVQVRSLATEKVVGTGIVVSRDGMIITCLHVLEMAGINPIEAGDKEVSVCFPKNRYRQMQVCKATVLAYFPDYDDDIVILKINNPPSLSPDQVAILGTAELSSGNPFRSYGFRQLGDSPSGYADGEIMGPVLPFLGKNALVDPIELRTRDIRPGMSGAAVLDIKRNLVIGLVAKRWNPGDKCTDDNIAWAVDNYVFTFHPVHLTVLEDEHERSNGQ